MSASTSTAAMPSLVGGWIESAIVSKVINSLVAYTFEDQPKWQGGLKAERKRLEKALPQILALLDVVEHNHFLMKETSELKKWMWRFRDAVEEAEDFMHEIEYQRLKKEIKGGKSKVSSAASRIKTIVKRGLHKVVERLDKAVSGIGDFDKLIETWKKDKQPLGEKMSSATNAPQTGSLLTVERVFGRENEKKEVINKLLNSNPTTMKNFSILPIVGDGGVGKTTLAQFVYRDEKIKKKFNKMMWVCVSNNPDLVLLTQKIYESTVGENSTFVNLDKLQEKISDELKSQRFLLVLDDVSGDINLHTLLAPLKSGEKGSMILLTTRMTSVVETMKDKLEPVFLYGLGEVDYWEFFKKCAFRDGKPENHMSLQDIGRRIAEKLKGFPLAAKTVGALLSTNLDYQHWKNILNSDIWKQKQNENDIIPALKLSYQYLPSHLKPCFRFCSIFPQDYMFNKEKLVYMWMALGLLHYSKKTPPSEDTPPEDIGDEYLNDLVVKSFFDCKTYRSGDTYYVIHDLLHELATSVSEGECFRIVDSSKPILESVRHLSINTSVSLPIPKIAKLKYLRTLLLLEKSNPNYCHIPEVLKGLRSLRILDSSYFQITGDCFGNLKHLQFFNHDCAYDVPESVNKLYHLQFLNHGLLYGRLRYSAELREKDYISNLIKLRRLGTPNSANGIVYGLGRLTSLQILQRLNVGEGDNVNKIVELKNLTELRELSIKNLDDVTRVEEVDEANLKNKKHLRELKLTWTRDDRKHGRPEDVLDALQPHSNLKNLEIRRYVGRRIPDWMTHSEIVSLTLLECKGLVDLSPLGQLSLLEYLKLDSMDSVKRVGAKPADNGTENRVFPSLQMLYICGLPALREFYGEASWTPEWLPWLKELSIRGCPNLIVFPNLPCGLRKLDIDGVSWDALPDLWVQSGNNDGRSMPPYLSSDLSSLQISSCPRLTSLAKGLLKRSELFTSLEKLVISKCRELTHLPIGGFPKFTSLKKLDIEDCPKLRRGPTLGRFLPASLQTLTVKDCDVLDPLPRSCITSLPSAQVLRRTSTFPKFTSPKELKIQDCPKLRRTSTFPSSLLDPLPWSLEDLNFLFDVSLDGNTSITSLPSAQVLGKWKSLKELYIENCSELESLGGLRALSSLKNLTVVNCPKLVATASSSLSPSNGFSSLSTSFILDELQIDDPLLLGTEQLKSISAREVCLECCINVRSSALEEWALKNRTTLQQLSISRVSSQHFPLAELQRLSCLKSLVVYECRDLRLLPQLPTSLDILQLSNCPPELEERCRKDSGPDWRKIQHIPDVRIGHFYKDELATMRLEEHIRRRQMIKGRRTRRRIYI